MRIEKVIFKNYRQFRDVEISFNQQPYSDLQVIIGKNGAGKTNILNGINWCLYGDEPHLSKDSQQLPLLNLKTIEEMSFMIQASVMVEIWAETEEGEYMTFTRTALFQVYEDGAPAHQNTQFVVKVLDDRGNTKIIEGEEADTYVDRFVPRRIREFFFFDGERLDRYFKEATALNIRHAVFQISQLDLLEQAIERKLKDTVGDLVREAGKSNPDIDKTQAELNSEEDKLQEIEQRIEQFQGQIATAKASIEEYQDKLSRVPDIESLEEKRKRLGTEKKEKGELLDNKKNEKRDLLFEHGRLLMLHTVIRQGIQVINEKKDNEEIPPTVDRALLEKILQDGTCNVCGNPLSATAKKHVEVLLQEISLSSEVAQQLIQMEAPLRQFEDKIARFEHEIRRATRELENYERDLSEIEQGLNAIDQEIGGYDEQKIRAWHSERRRLERVYEQDMRALALQEAEQDKVRKTLGELKEKLERELSKEEKLKALKHHIHFCQKALDVVRKTREIIMEETRQKIETETQRLFFELLWKRSTFARVTIGEDYNISLTHTMGYECLGSMSAGERELLALSFTLALHEVSGFDSPILIDTPVARVSDEHRENFGKIFEEVSQGKQTILLFTRAEYSEEISRLLDSKASGRYALVMSSDERMTNLEAL